MTRHVHIHVFRRQDTWSWSVDDLGELIASRRGCAKQREARAAARAARRKYETEMKEMRKKV